MIWWFCRQNEACHLPLIHFENLILRSGNSKDKCQHFICNVFISVVFISCHMPLCTSPMCLAHDFSAAFFFIVFSSLHVMLRFSKVWEFWLLFYLLINADTHIILFLKFVSIECLAYFAFVVIWFFLICMEVLLHLLLLVLLLLSRCLIAMNYFSSSMIE